MDIKRRDFLQAMGASLVLGPSVAGLAAEPSAAPAGRKTRPNILLIEVDQMHWSAVAGRSQCNMPHVNQLIKEGLNFERAYTAVSICGPSRAMMNSGAFHWHNGVFNQTHSAPSANPDMFPEVVLFSQQMKSAGYRQGFIGKWDASMKRTPLNFGYDEVADPIAYGRRIIKSLHANPDNVPDPPTTRAASVAGIQGARYLNWPGTKAPFLMWGHFDFEEEVSSTYFTAENGIRMMKRFSAQPEPWHLQIQFHQPHDPYVPLKKYLDRYNPADIPVPKSWYDTFKNKPELHAREAASWLNVDEAIFREGRAHYYAYCEEADAQVGRILKALDDTGQRDDTLVVFTTDHGDMCGNHHMWSKDWMPYEDTYRIPMVMRWPGHTTPGTSTSKLVHVHDLAYTFVEAAGAPKLPFEDGRSLLPLAADQDPKDWPDHILNVWYGGEFFRQLHMVVTDRHKFIFNSFGFDELYDLHSDPEEMTNLLDDPAHGPVADDMRARCYELLAQFGSPYGYPSPNFRKTDYGMPNRYGAPRYLPRGKRLAVAQV